jgi:hypothetical protein
MKNNFSIALMLLVTNVFAQGPSINWQRSLGGSSDDYANDVHQTADGGYIVAGYSMSNNWYVSGNHGGKDYWIVKQDIGGTPQWSYCFGGTDDDVATSVQQTSDNGYIVAGYSRSADGNITAHHGLAGIEDYWIIKLTGGGILQWQISLGGTNYDAAFSVQQTTDHGYIIAGLTESADGDVTINHGNSDYWVVKLSSTGALLWQKTYGGTSYDNANSIQQTSDGGFIIAGSSYSADGDATFNHGVADYWIVKTNPTGIVQWQKSYGGTNVEIATFIRQTTDNGFIIAGYTDSYDGDVTPNYSPSEFWIVKTDTAGTIQWQKPMGGQGTDVAYAVDQTADGGYILAGISSSQGGDVIGYHAVNDCWIAKLNSTGNILWSQCYGGQWDEGATAIHQTADGGYIFAGHAMPNSGDVTGNSGGHDYWIVKLNAPVGINEISDPAPILIFPNPANNSFTVNGNEGKLISMFNAMGELVFSHEMMKGDNVIDVSSFADGIYFVRMENGKQAKVVVQH